MKNTPSTTLIVGLIGAGPMGRRRAEAIKASPGSSLAIVADIDEPRARTLAREVECQATARWQDVVEREDIDIVVVSLPTYLLAPVSLAALKGGKHVLCEKPLARTVDEAHDMVETARACGVMLKTGYNLRHYPAIKKAHDHLPDLGELLFLRCRYGHGGRPGYEKEWRCSPELSGGGELKDQGVHIIDLFRWFMGDFTSAQGTVSTSFWDMKVEENAFAILQTAKGQPANLHASWTQWKNLFSLEVFGKNGYAIVEGLGGSYGVPKLTLGWRPPQGGVPKQEVHEFPGPDLSCHEEWAEFTSAIRDGREPMASGFDGLQVLRTVYAIYQSAREGRTVKL